MVDFVEAWLKPQFMVMVLAAIATFVTVLTIALPVLSRDRTAQRMKVMATERDKMRSKTRRCSLSRLKVLWWCIIDGIPAMAAANTA